MDFSQLCALFDQFPQPVYFHRDGAILYRNPQGAALEEELRPVLHVLFAQEGQAQGAENFVLSALGYRVSMAPLLSGRVLVLYPEEGEKPAPDVSRLPTQLRQYLAGLTAATEQFTQLWAQGELPERADQFLAIQNQAALRILRLVRQLEFSQEDWGALYPLGVLRLDRLCDDLAGEVSFRADGDWFQYQCKAEPGGLFVNGNPSLLRHLILGLLSNARKAAGAGGRAGLTLTSQGGRARLTVWDSGPGITPQQLSLLFLRPEPKEMPLPGEGLGLDLWQSNRIAGYHGGVIMAGNLPEGGAAFTLSLPLESPKNLSLRSPEVSLDGEGISPVLLGLSDALPWQCFRPSREE